MKIESSDISSLLTDLADIVKEYEFLKAIDKLCKASFEKIQADARARQIKTSSVIRQIQALDRICGQCERQFAKITKNRNITPACRVAMDKLLKEFAIRRIRFVAEKNKQAKG